MSDVSHLPGPSIDAMGNGGTRGACRDLDTELSSTKVNAVQPVVAANAKKPFCKRLSLGSAASMLCRPRNAYRSGAA